MFPTTVWTNIARAGAWEADALESFADSYRPPVLRFIRSRGFGADDGEDLCQDVFVRILKGNVLARADASRGRFRSLLLAVTVHVIQDRLRKKREIPVPELEVAQQEPDFDREWAFYLVERAFARLKGENPRYYAVLRGHLTGERPDRQKLWIARRKLIAMIRAEVAGTCGSHREFEEEVAYLSSYLRRNLGNVETLDLDPRTEE